MEGHMKVLTAREAKVVEAIGLTLFPSGGAIPLDAKEAGIVDYVDDLLFHIPMQERLLIRAMFALFELGPVLIPHPRPGPFTRLKPEHRATHLLGWENSRFFARRTAYSALRSVMMMAYGGNAEVERAMGVINGAEATRAWRERRGSAVEAN